MDKLNEFEFKVLKMFIEDTDSTKINEYLGRPFEVLEDRDSYNKVVKKLLDNGFVEKIPNRKTIVTELGRQYVEKNK